MPKLYYPTPDEIQGARPLNEQLWFPQHQALLLPLVNTNEGRDILCIDPWRKMPFPIVKIAKNYVRYYLGRWDGRDWYLSDFRVGAKWGNVTRSRWPDVRKALDRVNLLEMRQWPQVEPFPGAARLRETVWRATTTVYPDPHPESTSVDGTVSHYDAGALAWTSLVGAAGSAFTDNQTNISIVNFKSHVSANWIQMYRGILLFDTSSIPAADTISSATMSINGTAKADQNGGNPIDINIYASAPADVDKLAAGDFNSLGTTPYATTITYANWLTTPAYNDFTINATGLATIAQGSGVTKWGVRDPTFDVADSAPAFGGDQKSELVGNLADVAGTASDPKLAVVHVDFTFEWLSSLPRGSFDPLILPTGMRPY